MNEHGFYHPSVGYWQTLTDPTGEQLAEYPEGTVEIPLMPMEPGFTHTWDYANQVWVAERIKLNYYDFDSAFNIRCEEVARAKNYASVSTLLSYANSNNAKRKADFLAFNSWRDSASDPLIAIEDGFAEQGDAFDYPTVQEFLDSLPPAPWPTPAE